MRSRRAVLDAADVQRSGVEIDLLPAKITDFGCTEPMPERKQDHKRIAVALPIRASDFD
jgi:hypothetical protein